MNLIESNLEKKLKVFKLDFSLNLLKVEIGKFSQMIYADKERN